MEPSLIENPVINGENLEITSFIGKGFFGVVSDCIIKSHPALRTVVKHIEYSNLPYNFSDEEYERLVRNEIEQS